jgi:hypothetical protein
VVEATAVVGAATGGAGVVLTAGAGALLVSEEDDATCVSLLLEL